jgi:hypothetical protein
VTATLQSPAEMQALLTGPSPDISLNGLFIAQARGFCATLRPEVQLRKPELIMQYCSQSQAAHVCHQGADARCWSVQLSLGGVQRDGFLVGTGWHFWHVPFIFMHLQLLQMRMWQPCSNMWGELASLPVGKPKHRVGLLHSRHW